MKGAFQSGTGNTFDSFTDGLSNTLLVGEKHVPMGKEGRPAWDCSIFNGGMFKCSSRAAGRLFPLTTDIRNMGWLFGSRHTGVVNFVFADGHVQSLPERIDPLILELLAVRNDGQVIPNY